MNADDLPVAQYLVMETLAARHRTGETLWTFPARCRPQLRALEAAGLAWWKEGVAPRTVEAGLTDAGRALMLSDTYVSPIEAKTKRDAELSRQLDEAEARRRPERKAQVEGPFNDLAPFLHLANYGLRNPVFLRLRDALATLREWRWASQTRGGDYEEVILAVRVVSDALARQIEAGFPVQDDTIRWVLAGLRCPAQPFCTGCTACQTITAPLRPNAEVPSSVW